MALLQESVSCLSPLSACFSVAHWLKPSLSGSGLVFLHPQSIFYHTQPAVKIVNTGEGEKRSFSGESWAVSVKDWLWQVFISFLLCRLLKHESSPSPDCPLLGNSLSDYQV